MRIQYSSYLIVYKIIKYKMMRLHAKTLLLGAFTTVFIEFTNAAIVLYEMHVGFNFVFSSCLGMKNVKKGIAIYSSRTEGGTKCSPISLLWAGVWKGI